MRKGKEFFIGFVITMFLSVVFGIVFNNPLISVGILIVGLTTTMFLISSD